jgi:DNA-directed RNA polymerase subunit E'/Rpb7
MRVRISVTVDVDPEEFPMPADGYIAEEIEDLFTGMIYDMEGLKLRYVNAKMENK